VALLGAGGQAINDALLNSQQLLRDLAENSSALHYPTNFFPQNPCRGALDTRTIAELFVTQRKKNRLWVLWAGLTMSGISTAAIAAVFETGPSSPIHVFGTYVGYLGSPGVLIAVLIAGAATGNFHNPGPGILILGLSACINFVLYTLLLMGATRIIRAIVGSRTLVNDDNLLH